MSDFCEILEPSCEVLSTTGCSKTCGIGEMEEEYQCGNDPVQTRTRKCCPGPCTPGGMCPHISEL